jgi:hypothetical protein
MHRIHFEDDGQDLIMIDVDSSGEIVAEFITSNRWIGHKVLNLKELVEGNEHIVTVKVNNKPSALIYQVERVEKL